MNKLNELRKIEVELTRAAELVYLMMSNPQTRGNLRDIILKIENSLARAKNLEDEIYLVDDNE